MVISPKSVTWIVINIPNLSQTHLVTNSRHQHRPLSQTVHFGSFGPSTLAQDHQLWTGPFKMYRKDRFNENKSRNDQENSLKIFHQKNFSAKIVNGLRWVWNYSWSRSGRLCSWPNPSACKTSWWIVPAVLPPHPSSIPIICHVDGAPALVTYEASFHASPAPGTRPTHDQQLPW